MTCTTSQYSILQYGGTLKMVALSSTEGKLAQYITHETAARHIKLICLVSPEHNHCHADISIYHKTLGCIYIYICDKL